MIEKNFTKYLSQVEIEEVKKAFAIFDQDDSGSISIKEFDQILKSLGQNLREEQLQKIVQTIDKDQNGLIDLDQFLYLVAPKIISNRSQRSYVEAFRAIDVKNQGYLTLVQLQKANKVTSAELTNEDLNDIMHYVEAHFDGKFDLETVLTMLQRIPQKEQDHQF